MTCHVIIDNVVFCIALLICHTILLFVYYLCIASIVIVLRIYPLMSKTSLSCLCKFGRGYVRSTYIDKDIGAIMYGRFWTTGRCQHLQSRLPTVRARAQATSTAHAWNHTVEFAKIRVTRKLDDKRATWCSLSTFSNIYKMLSYRRETALQGVL